MYDASISTVNSDYIQEFQGYTSSVSTTITCALYTANKTNSALTINNDGLCGVYACANTQITFNPCKR